MKVSLDSLVYWFPKLRDLDIPQPRTKIIWIEGKEFDSLYNERIPKSLISRVQELIDEEFKLPVFLRTDLMSGKFSWEKSCFYDGTRKLWLHLHEVVVHNLLADLLGLPFRAIVVREYIQMDDRFKAFPGRMPINPERRYFVEDGKVLCHHPYWIEDAVERGSPFCLSLSWKKLLSEANFESEEEIAELFNYAAKVAGVLPGFWSVDFCKARDGTWVLIDCARGEKSWHPDCEHNRTKTHDYIKDGIPRPSEKDFIEVEWEVWR